MKFSKGSVAITAIIGVLALIIIGGGIWYYIENKPTACTEEAKICPNGTAVGHTGPNCEFAECPVVGCVNQCGDGACQEVVCEAIGCPCSETVESCSKDCKKDETVDWKTYKNEKLGIEFKYPENWRIMNDESIWVRITDYFPKDEEKATGGWPVGYGFIAVAIYKNTTVDKITAEILDTNSATKITQSNAVIDGYSGKKLIFNSSIEGESYNVQNLIQKDASVYELHLSFNSDTEVSIQLQLISIFEQILSTFKFIE